MENLICNKKVKESKYFNYYEVELGEGPCVMHLGEWMWTTSMKGLIYHFDNYILRPSLLEICDDELDEHNLTEEVTEVIIDELSKNAPSIIEQLIKVKSLREKIINTRPNFEVLKDQMYETVKVLNELGVEIKIHLYQGWKDALELLYEHGIDIDIYDDLTEAFTDDISM